jgi:hypothetical protein
MMSRVIRLAAFLVAVATLGLASSAQAQWKACKADGSRLCPGMKPGGAEYIQCIKDNKEQLSPGCKSAVEQVRSKKQEQQQQPQEQQPTQP